jgi:hypothetical protein
MKIIRIRIRTRVVRIRKLKSRCSNRECPREGKRKAIVTARSSAVTRRGILMVSTHPSEKRALSLLNWRKTNH